MIISLRSMAGLVCVAMPLAASAAPAYVAHEIVDATGLRGIPAAITDAGSIGGTTVPRPPHAAQGFVAQGLQVSTLTWPGADYSEIDALDDAGDVAGIAKLSGVAGTRHAFVQLRGAAALQMVPGKVETYAIGMSADGTVLGWAIQSGDTNFLWKDGQLTWFGGQGTAMAINGAGVVTGNGVVPGTTKGRAWRFDGSTTTWLPPVPGLETYCGGSGIDAANDVVGYCLGAVGRSHPVAWPGDGGMPTLLPMPANTLAGAAIGTDGAHIVLGWTTDPQGGHAIVWQDGVPFDLDTVTKQDTPAAHFEMPVAINAAGQILVSGPDLATARTRYFRLDPAKEPPAPR